MESKSNIEKLLHMYSKPIYPDWHIPIDKEEQKLFKNSGNLIIVNNRENLSISQSIANTIDEALIIIEDLRNKAKSLGFKVFFRGQNQDFFNDEKCLSILPSAFRPNTHSPFSYITNLKEVKETLLPWLFFLEHHGIEVGNALKFESIDDDSGLGILRLVTGKNRTSDGFIGILQHYGFPTYFIDISENALVAIWFALNKGVEVSKGIVKMTPLKAKPIKHKYSDAIEIAEWPTLHIYFQKENDEEYPIIDVRDLGCFNTPSCRPQAQEGYVIPFKSYSKTQPQDAVWTFEMDIKRWPFHIIKLGFDYSEFHSIFPKYSKEFLLPNKDPLYQDLISEKIPGVIRYED